MSWRDTETSVNPMSDRKNKKQPKESPSSWRDTEKEVNPLGRGTPSAPSDGSVSETVMDILTTAPQGISAWADEAMARASATLQKGGGRKDPWSEIYEESVEGIREDISQARERTPWGTALGEVGTGIATSMIPGLGTGKVVGFLGGVGRGLVEGWGASEDKLSGEGATQAAIGGGLGAVGGLASTIGKKLFHMDPNTVRANVLGSRASAFQETGIKDRKKIAKVMSDKGLLSTSKSKFNPDTLKWEKELTGLKGIEKPVKDKVLDRINEANDSIQESKKRIMARYGKDVVNANALENNLDLSIHDFTRGVGQDKRLDQAQKVKDVLMKDIQNISSDLNGSYLLTVDVLEELKYRLSKEVSNYGKNPLIKDTPDIDELYQGMYRAVNETLRDAIPDVKYRDMNEFQNKMLTVKGDLIKEIASGDTLPRSSGLPRNFVERALDSTITTDENRLVGANVKEFVDRMIPRPVQSGALMGGMELPYQGIRYLDDSTTRDYSRSPQSVMGMRPHQIQEMKLPRTLEGIKQHGQILLAKMAQTGASENEVYGAAMALKTSDKALKGILTQLMTAYPQMFEEAEYNTLDGTFLSPEDQYRAIEDIQKSNLPSIDKFNKINTISKHGRM